MTPGGSSAGAAAAVAAGMGPLAQGSDGAGSVRIPAALTGVVGMKPSWGRIPQNILPSRHQTFVSHGVIARTVADAALMLGVAAGAHPSDPLSLPPEGGYLDALAEGLGDLRIAWSPDLGFAQVDPEVAEICARAVKAFAELGCTVEAADPGWDDPEETMWTGLWGPIYSSLLDEADWDTWAGQVDEQLMELMREGAAVSALEVARADLARGGMWDRYAALMSDYDLLVSPTLTTAAFPLDRFCPEPLAGEPLRTQILGWLLTYPCNMLGAPAISIPAGFTSTGLPVGLHISGRMHADRDVLRAAAAFERIRPWAARRPEL
jgi:aspartyl-tRNA(Asn)/glutamyl-tRNA(Gln) amidotransferase subunit A